MWLLVSLLMLVTLFDFSSKIEKEEPSRVDKLSDIKLKVKQRTKVTREVSVKDKNEEKLDRILEKVEASESNNGPENFKYDPKKDPVSKEEVLSILQRIYEGGSSK